MEEENNHCKWLSYVTALSKALLPYRNDRPALLRKLRGCDNPTVSRVAEGVRDVDPFSVVALAFRKGKDETLERNQNSLRDLFGLHVPAPGGCAGTPLINPRSAFFFAKDDVRKPEIDNLWALYEAVLNGTDNLPELFDAVLKQRYTKAQFTFILFLIKPGEFLALDHYNRSYLASYGIEIPSSVRTYEQYTGVMDQVRAKMKSGEIPAKSFCEISIQAYNYEEGDAGEEETDEDLLEWVRIWRQRRNLILQGAPGTGKTYSIPRLIRALGVPSEADGTYTRSPWVQWVTFHANYDYSDFVEGIRAHVQNGQVVYEVRDGVFKSLCKEAAQNPDKPFVIAIDEMNRGNVAAIFGELMTLLEVDKRDGAEHAASVCLPISRERFSVPANVYLLGTMNTADYSLTKLDYALRRRFAFVRMEPHELDDADFHEVLFASVRQLFEKEGDEGPQASALVSPGMDYRDFMLGHAYFLSGAHGSIQDRWKHEIRPVLEAYVQDGVLRQDALTKIAEIERDFFENAED